MPKESLWFLIVQFLQKLYSLLHFIRILNYALLANKRLDNLVILHKTCLLNIMQLK